MRAGLTLILTTLPGAALAHAGHVAPVDGHGHGELVALGVALVLLAAWALGRRA